MSASEAIAGARAALRIGVDEFALLTGVEGTDVRRAERGEGQRLDEIVSTTAQVFGLEVAELLREGVADRPATAMLKSFLDESPDSAFLEMIHQGLHASLGAFARQLRRKAWLRRILGKTAPALPSDLTVAPVPIADGAIAPYGAVHLAERLRDELRLGDDPIPSMVSLVRDRMQIDVQFTAPPRLWRNIDGASVSTGSVRGMLVNLDGGPGRWWHTRTTIAHELCHLLFDGGIFDGSQRSVLIFSPSAERTGPRGAHWQTRGRAWDRHRVFRRVEARANAFAAYLLAPPRAIRRLFASREPPQSPDTVRKVATHFGLHVVTAVNVLTNVYGWSREDRYRLLDDVNEDAPPSKEHPDSKVEVRDDDLELTLLANEAVSRGRLLPTTRDDWCARTARAPGPEAAVLGDFVRGYWSWRDAHEAAAMVHTYLHDKNVDAALRVVWDAVDDWIDDDKVSECLALMQALSPGTIDTDVTVGLLAATQRAPALRPQRRAFRHEARATFLALGRDLKEFDSLFGSEDNDES